MWEDLGAPTVQSRSSKKVLLSPGAAIATAEGCCVTRFNRPDLLNEGAILRLSPLDVMTMMLGSSVIGRVYLIGYQEPNNRLDHPPYMHSVHLRCDRDAGGKHDEAANATQVDCWGEHEVSAAVSMQIN